MKILQRLIALQLENNVRAISMRQLTDELYPNKEYNAVKSTLSEYLVGMNFA